MYGLLVKEVVVKRVNEQVIISPTIVHFTYMYVDCKIDVAFFLALSYPALCISVAMKVN